MTGRIEDKNLKFMVEDHGTGIPEFALEKVFDKFFSLQHPDSGKKSTGLRLNVVKEIAMLHKGDVKVRESPGQGRPGNLDSSRSGPIVSRLDLNADSAVAADAMSEDQTFRSEVGARRALPLH